MRRIVNNSTSYSSVLGIKNMEYKGKAEWIQPDYRQSLSVINTRSIKVFAFNCIRRYN